MNIWQNWKTGSGVLVRLLCAFVLMGLLFKPLDLFAHIPAIYGMIAAIGYLLFLPLVVPSILSLSGLKVVPMGLFSSRGGANEASVTKQKELDLVQKS